MRFIQYYLECLSQASYLIGDEAAGRAVVVDPRRDVSEYLSDAQGAGLAIVGVINTHFHADFVSGHLELAARTGAWIGYGEPAEADFEIRPLTDGERIVLGDVTLEIMATPGHTPESISVLVREHAADPVPYAALTGDALFIGDVGRPDLLASAGVSGDELGAMLYDSVHRKLMGLPDPVRVFPAHGAGSACGKNLSTERQSTIGEQRRSNYACHPMEEQAFIDIVTEGQPVVPQYFAYAATLNQRRRPLLGLDVQLPALTGDQIAAALASGAIIHDARSAPDFAAGHLSGSINVPVDGRMAETVGMVLPPDQDVIVIAPEDRAAEVAMRCARIGYDRVIGFIADPQAYFLNHVDQVDRASRLTVAETDAAAKRADIQVLDLRNAGELAVGMVPGALHIPLAELNRRYGELDPERPVLAYCAGGWRSSVGASLLRAHGFGDVSDLLGGFNAWIRAGEGLSALSAARG